MIDLSTVDSRVISQILAGGESIINTRRVTALTKVAKHLRSGTITSGDRETYWTLNIKPLESFNDTSKLLNFMLNQMSRASLPFNTVLQTRADITHVTFHIEYVPLLADIAKLDESDSMTTAEFAEFLDLVVK